MGLLYWFYFLAFLKPDLPLFRLTHRDARLLGHTDILVCQPLPTCSTDSAQSSPATSHLYLEKQEQLPQKTEFREFFEPPICSATDHVTAGMGVMPISSTCQLRHDTNGRGTVLRLGSFASQFLGNIDARLTHYYVVPQEIL
jgi:hypothetical protein